MNRETTEPSGRSFLQDVANVNIAIFVEIRMKGQAVERGQVGMQLGEVERQVGLLAAGIVGKRDRSGP